MEKNKFLITNARNLAFSLRKNLAKRFGIDEKNLTDFALLTPKTGSYLLLTGINKQLPVLKSALNQDNILSFFLSLDSQHSYRLDCANGKLSLSDDALKAVNLPADMRTPLLNQIRSFEDYGGTINDKGEEVLNLKCPSVGVHYGVNLLLGNRMGFDHPLQTTPKSVVDYLGRGSFRGHSSFQVLATSWGLLPEENGFPANRQFYLLEDGHEIFYSATIDDSIKKAECIHSQNLTTISYVLNCGLKITRTIFLLPQYEGLPDAVEVQSINIANLTDRTRNLRLVYTGMFGFANPHCQEEDVIYSTLITQGQVLTNDAHEIVAITPSYYPEYFKREIRFCSLKDADGYADSFATNYQDFVGRGSLAQPEGLGHLDNALSLKGPNFFALGKPIVLDPHGKHDLDTFTGVVDATKTHGDEDLELLEDQLDRLLTHFAHHEQIKKEISHLSHDYQRYSSFLQIQKAQDPSFVTYVNTNLPFQVCYQTFVSRSFAMTQKGYREIGFREIQDLYASMYYLYSQGKKTLLRELLSQWAENVYAFGYANHNFFFVGKEPGQCSDDPLWFVMAVYRYVSLTGDKEFLGKHFLMAGSSKRRSILDTLKAIVLYSGSISVGKHGLPLLDCADWNDCLRIDPDYLDGPTKEKAYRSQLRKNRESFGAPFISDYSESVMNAFLLVIAAKNLSELCQLAGQPDAAKTYDSKAQDMTQKIQASAYIHGYFARVLINRDNPHHIRYIGSAKDGLSLDPSLDGSYYLNSFSWSLLSGVAREAQIKEMLPVLDRALKTPAGFKLCTMHDLSLAGAKNSATDHYFVGDRENGGVFKHATMMLTVALLQSSKTVKDPDLQAKLLSEAYEMLDIVMPYRTLQNPGKYKGNPRFCTQYNNSRTEENIGPMLSGTATWLTLSVLEEIGLEMHADSFALKPALRAEETDFVYTLSLKGSLLKVEIRKPAGSACNPTKVSVILDGKPVSFPLPVFHDHQQHSLVMTYSPS